MNLFATLSITSAALAIYVGVLAYGLSLAPGWRDQHAFSGIAFTSAGYALCNLASSLSAPDHVVIAASQLQGAFAVLQVWAWCGYAQSFLGQTGLSPYLPWIRRGLLLAAALELVPGLPLTGEVVAHTSPLFGNVYKDALPSVAGVLIFALVFAAAFALVARFAAAWRAGVAHAGLHTLAFAALLAFATNDMLVSSGRWAAPYLLDTGFVVPVLAVAWTLTARFGRDARALQVLTRRLEVLVEERSRALGRAQVALVQAERLASLGQFAAGVAHQVNNPAAVVTSNLRYLAQSAGEDRLPEDAAESLGDALASMQRINALVRKLVDAGRLAEVSSGGDTAPLAEALRQAMTGLGLPGASMPTLGRRPPEGGAAVPEPADPQVPLASSS